MLTGNARKNIRDMNYKVALQADAGISDGAGGFETNWTTIATVFAAFPKPRRIRPLVETGTAISDLTQDIRIWIRADVKKGWRVIWGARTYEVQHTYDEERIITVLVCREIVK